MITAATIKDEARRSYAVLVFPADVDDRLPKTRTIHTSSWVLSPRQPARRRLCMDWVVSDAAMTIFSRLAWARGPAW